MHGTPLLFGLLFLAQAPEPIRVTTRLVEVSVAVRDKSGEPVAGLTKEDFSVFDQGRPQPVAVFKTEAARPAVPPRPLPANMFTNRGTAPTGATVILFDGLNTHITDRVYAKEQILKFLRQMQPGGRVALYAMGRGPRLLQDFTEDPAKLAAALASEKAAPAGSLDDPLYAPSITGAAHLQSWLGELSFGLYDYYGEDRAFRTVRALIAIANHLQSLPGRKNLIWVSGSFPVSLAADAVPAPRKSATGKRDYTPEVERAVRAFANADLAIYPVDARGLMAAQEYIGSPVQPKVQGPDTTEFAAMQFLAERTGGRAFYNNNDLAAALRQAADDVRVTYTIGYYPSHRDWNGRFRRIEIRVDRPGLELLYRRGYYAQPEEPAQPWYREQVLDAALWSPVDATALGLTVAATPSSSGGLDLALQLDARDITLRQDGAKWTGGLDLWLVQLDGKERRIHTDARTNNLSLEPQTYERVMKVNGLMLLERVVPAPEARLVRVLVRDIASGALGSVTIPLKPRGGS